MGRGGQIAFAVATGYALGRGRRMRWALALGAAAAAGRLTAGSEGLTGKLRLLSASRGLGRLLEAGRPLASAGGAAARTAVGGRIDSAADRLQQTAERLRGSGRSDADEARTREPAVEDTDADELYAGEQDDSRYDNGDGYDDGDNGDDGDLGDEDRDDEDQDDEDPDGEDPDDEDRGDRRRGGRTRAVESPRPPVRRRGR